MKIIRKIVLICMFIFLIRWLLLYGLAHHEKETYADVIRIEVSSSDIYERYKTYNRCYIDQDEIRKVLKKFEQINLLRDFGNTLPGESPSSELTIFYKDGTEKNIVVSGWLVQICTGQVGTKSRKVRTYFIRDKEYIDFFSGLPQVEDVMH